MLTIHYQNSEVSSYLEHLRVRLGDLQPVFEDIGTTIESRVSARFETETDPLGIGTKTLMTTNEARTSLRVM